MMSSVMRPSSSAGIALEPVVSAAFGPNAGVSTAFGASAVLMSSLMTGSLSCKDTLRLDQRLRQRVHLGAGVVERERGAAGRGHAIAREQRHGAMRAGADCNAGAVDHGRDIVRMRALQLERHDRALFLCGADDA